MDSGFHRNDGNRVSIRIKKTTGNSRIALGCDIFVSGFPTHQPSFRRKPESILPQAMKQPCVHILASRKHGTLQTGVAPNLLKRVTEHKEGAIPGFAHRYGVKAPVYFGLHETMEAAIAREKQIKEWKRVWKVELTEKLNP